MDSALSLLWRRRNPSARLPLLRTEARDLVDDDEAKRCAVAVQEAEGCHRGHREDVASRGLATLYPKML